jgi:hypothetical protein
LWLLSHFLEIVRYSLLHTMPKGISLHIGLNRVDPQIFAGWAKLQGAENDARAMEAIARLMSGDIFL